MLTLTLDMILLRILRRRCVMRRTLFVTLLNLKSAIPSMKMNVKLFTKRGAPQNMNLNAPQVSCYTFSFHFNIFTYHLHHTLIVLFTEYVETCQPTYGGNVLLATYSEG